MQYLPLKMTTLMNYLVKFTPRLILFERCLSPPPNFCGLDVLEPGFVFNGEEGRQRIVDHCLSQPTKGEVLIENGLGNWAALEIFVSLFQTLLEQRGRCSGIVKGNQDLYLDYIGLMSDVATSDVTPNSRYYFLGFKARRLDSDLFAKAIIRADKTPKRDKKSRKFDDALTEREEAQVYNLVCKELAVELSKMNEDETNLEKYKQQASDACTDTTSRSKRSSLYVEYAKKLSLCSQSLFRVGALRRHNVAL